MADPYADGVLYDLEYADYDEDVPFYVERARAAEGPLLELGCGTGRLTIPMARTGATIVGLDRAAAMLDELRHRLEAEPPEVRARVTLHEADYLRSLPEPTTPYGLVVWPFNALHHCADPQQVADVLRRVRAHTAPGGRLVLDCYLPAPHLFGRDPDRQHEYRQFTHPRSGARIESWERDAWDEERQIHHVTYVYQEAGAPRREVELALRMFSLVEVRRALAVAGWRLVHEGQDFRGTKLTPAALKWVGVAVRA